MMNQAKIFKINNNDTLLTDEELIELIKTGKIAKETEVITKDMKHYIRLKDSIYQFYFKEDENETI